MKTLALLLVSILLCGCEDILDKVGIGDEITDIETEPTQQPSGEYAIVHVGSNKIAWTGPNLPWPTGGSPVPSACAEGHLYRANGKGGKWDWVRPDTKERDFKNVHTGYGVWASVGVPSAGELVTFVAVNRHNHSERIVIGTFSWK